MKAALLFDGVSAFAPAADRLILETVDAIEQSLASEGNKVTRVPVTLDGRWVDKLRRGKFDIVFNMCEGIDGAATLEPAVISVLELLGIPFTGSGSFTTALCLRKHAVNALLDQAGLPVPRFALVRRGTPLVNVGFPAIVKPAAEDASLGVEQRSVVRNMRALTARVDSMLACWDELIVQRYVDGREVNVGLLGNTVLPISEIDFSGMPRGRWRIVTYQSKWNEGSVEDLGAQSRCPARLTTKTANHVRRLALRAWSLVGGEGYGRIDMRIDERGQPWILEVNANPDIAYDAGLAGMALVAGIEYAPLIREICEIALQKSRESVTPPDDWARAQLLSGVELPESEPDLFAVGQ